MSEHHMSDRERTHEYGHERGGVDMLHATGRFAAAPSHARAAYVPPSFRRIEVVRTQGGAAGAIDGVFGVDPS